MSGAAPAPASLTSSCTRRGRCDGGVSGRDSNVSSPAIVLTGDRDVESTSAGTPRPNEGRQPAVGRYQPYVGLSNRSTARFVRRWPSHGTVLPRWPPSPGTALNQQQPSALRPSTGRLRSGLTIPSPDLDHRKSAGALRTWNSPWLSGGGPTTCDPRRPGSRTLLCRTSWRDDRGHDLGSPIITKDR